MNAKHLPPPKKLSALSTPLVQEIVKSINDLPTSAPYAAWRTLLIVHIRNIRNRLLDETINSPIENDTLCAFGVFLRGFMDYLAMCNIIQDELWFKDNRKVEAIWEKMWDCKDRVKAYPSVLEGAIVQRIDLFLNAIFRFYVTNFGNGLYMSPEIKIKRRNCSICGQNIKQCTHIPGRLYGGRRCFSVIVDAELLNASIVNNPRDPRCRIWPWYCDKDSGVMKGVCILTTFQIDDFLHDEKWEDIA